MSLTKKYFSQRILFFDCIILTTVADRISSNIDIRAVLELIGIFQDILKTVKFAYYGKASKMKKVVERISLS